MIIALIDYGSGNLRSAAKSFERAAREAGLVAKVEVTHDPDLVLKAERIVLPGVGAFSDCRAGIMNLPGLWPALEEAVIKKGRPFLGVCVGMQLMADKGLEHGTHKGFGWIPGEVVPLEINDPTLKVPHMGWNTLDKTHNHPVLRGIADDHAHAHAYFVHSYHLKPKNPDHKLASCHYGGEITAVVGRDNMIGTQFHPEKSQKTGLRLITNFLEWRP